MNLQKLEFEMLLLQEEDTTYVDTEDYKINNLEDDGYILVTLKNKDLTINLDKIIIYQARKVKYNTYRFQIKPEYMRFDDSKMMKNQFLYKKLFGNSIDNRIKRIIIFLSTIENQKQVQIYLSKLPIKVITTIKEFFKEK
jgi:hypothetical protein